MHAPNPAVKLIEWYKQTNNRLDSFTWVHRTKILQVRFAADDDARYQFKAWEHLRNLSWFWSEHSINWIRMIWVRKRNRDYEQRLFVHHCRQYRTDLMTALRMHMLQQIRQENALEIMACKLPLAIRIKHVACYVYAILHIHVAVNNIYAALAKFFEYVSVDMRLHNHPKVARSTTHI